MRIGELRSPHTKVGGIVYFGRMLDKIRIHSRGDLPSDYHDNLGQGFDLRCCRFLGVPYEEIKARTLQGGKDEDILAWCFEQGHHPDAEQIEVWNEFMRKRGWEDESSARLRSRLAEIGQSERTDIVTFFDFIDLDEGRDPAMETMIMPERRA